MTDDVSTIDMIGGRVCLDFANTVDWRISDHPQERINDYSDLITWSRRVSLTADSEASRLLRRAEQHPEHAGAVLAKAIDLRETIYRVFSPIVHGARPEAGDLDELNVALSAALARLRIAPVAGGFHWEWAKDDDALDWLLWPIARSAADLLVSRDLGRLRECAGSGCGWLFVDTSRNASRQWCSMDSCGNRAKARRHYQRQCQAGTPGDPSTC